jgi:predicted nucleotidyltransferase
MIKRFLFKGVFMDEKTKTAVTGFTARLKEVFAEDLLAAVLYGSAASGSYFDGLSDINVLVILKKCSAAQLSLLGKTAKILLRRHRISPLIMTREEFATASDVFPLEYCDILDANEVPYGNEEIIKISVGKENLRLQLEEKLRGAVGDIRAMLIQAGGNEKPLEKFILGLSSFGAVLFRGLLRLKGKSVIDLNAEATIALVEKEYGVSLESFSALNRLRLNKKIHPLKPIIFAETLLEALGVLVQKVDAMDGKTK